MKRFIASGATDTDVLEATGWSQSRITWARQNVLDDEKRAISQDTPLSTFATFRISCEANVVDLDKTIKLAIQNGQTQSAVSAIKAKQDIAESLIKRGQELGLIAKAVEGKALLIAGVDLSSLKPFELKAMVRDQSASLAGLMDRLDSPIIDVDPVAASAASA
ncbi:MAG: hypothetical protein KAT00_00420 [Planctomycetes bacterium]|nr:hypothetical protein [Planctomycetota bacterium]